MRLKPDRTGIILISVIFITVLIGMYVASTLILTRGQLMNSRQSKEDILAENAARSGLEYAVARLEENADWRGDGNGVTVDTPQLTVVEAEGNVVGIIRGTDGSASQFRLRFNYQDGNGGDDEFDDPRPELMIDNPHVSINNLTNNQEVTLPLADGPGYSVIGNVAKPLVPAGAVALVCEGRVSTIFSNADAKNPNPRGSQLQATRVIEALYRVNEIIGERSVEPAVSMSKTTTVELFDGDAAAPAVLTISDATGEGQPKVRTRELFETRNEDGSKGSVDGQDAWVLAKDPATHVLANLHTGVQAGSEDPNVAFYELTWDQLGDSSATAEDLKAGVYVYWEEDNKLHYYPKDYETYMSDIEANPKDKGVTAPELPKGLSFVPAGEAGPDGVVSEKHRFVMTGDLNVVEEGGATDLTILPRSGAKETLDETSRGGDGARYQTKTQWPRTFTGAATDASSSEKENALVNQFMHRYFDFQQGGTVQLIGRASLYYAESTETARQSDVALNFLQELAPKGEITGPNNARIAWKGNEAEYEGDVKNLMDQFARGNTAVEFKNYDMGTQNEQIVSPDLGAQTGDPVKIHDYLMAGGIRVNQLSEIDLKGAEDKLGAADYEFTFAPQSERGIRLTAPGDVRVAADVRGQGAAIKSKGEIRFTGVGFDLRADRDEEGPAISLYSEDSITISTLRKDADSAAYEYTGLDFRGIIYAWKDVNLLTGHADETSKEPQKVRLQGTVVAYGGEPGVDKPGDGEGGDLLITGDQVELIFDPGYLVGLTGGKGLRARLGLLSSTSR